MPHSRIDAVLLDLDGTLVDHVGAAAAAVVGWTRTLAPACSVPPEMLAEAWAVLEAEHFADYLAGSCSFAEQRRRRVLGFLSRIGVQPSAVDPDEAFAAYLRLYERAWRPFPDVPAALETLSATVR